MAQLTLKSKEKENDTVILENQLTKTQQLFRDKWLYILLIPGALYFILFKYLPMWGILISFQDYSPFRGFWDSEWVGFDHFINFFQNPDFFRLLRNTLILALYDLIFFFPAPIIIALMLNELRIQFFKRTIQTLVYIPPHFMSWVIIASITYVFLTTSGGAINALVEYFTGEQINFLSSPEWFRPMIIGQVIWKETGWGGTVIFLAALASVSAEQYEAASWTAQVVLEECGMSLYQLYVARL